MSSLGRSSVLRITRSGTSALGRSLHATWLGRVPYVDAWRMQEAVATRVREGGTERLLLLEHDPVYTIGRRGTTDHLLVGPDVLRAAGASVYRVDRGGDITYHGPGQLVGYPITAFAEGADLVGYVRAIEEALRDALASYGVASRTERGKTGVRSEEHTSELQSPCNLVCRLLLEKKKKND